LCDCLFSDVTINPNKPRKSGGSSTPASSSTASTTAATSVTTSYSEVSTSTQLSAPVENLTASSDYQKWQEMKNQFLQEMNQNKVEEKREHVNQRVDQNADQEADQEAKETEIKWHGLSEDPEDDQVKFPNFPPPNEVTNRTPRDHTSVTHSSTLSRLSEVTTPFYPNPSSVSTTPHAGTGLRFSSIGTTESTASTTRGSILAVLHSTTEGPIVFTLSPELQVQKMKILVIFRY